MHSQDDIALRSRATGAKQQQQAATNAGSASASSVDSSNSSSGGGSRSVVSENLKDLGRESALRQFRSLLDELAQTPDVLHEAGVRLAQKMAPQKRQEFLDTLRRTVAEAESLPYRSKMIRHGAHGPRTPRTWQAWHRTTIGGVSRTACSPPWVMVNFLH